MIVRQFISWVRTAPPIERAEATRSLAHAWLVSDLSEDERAGAEGALLMLLDDASPLVREAMADVFAGSAAAPPNIVAALAADQPSVACPVLEYSPLLIDADLVDMVATGNAQTQSAIARRAALPASVCAAIAEVGEPEATLELIENPDAQLAPFSLERIAERHGHLAAIRETLLGFEILSAATRLSLVEKLSATLAQFVAAREWLSADRAGRVTGEALERSTVAIAASSRDDDMLALVRHLRSAGQLTTGLIMRALLSGNLELFDAALVELSGLPRSRVCALLHDRGGASLNALLSKAGLPPATFVAFRAALEASHETGFTGTAGDATRLRRRMVERVLTQCEQVSSSAAEPLLILLRRFATESAREEARIFCDELAAEPLADVAQFSEFEDDRKFASVYDEAGYDADRIDDHAEEDDSDDSFEYAEDSAENGDERIGAHVRREPAFAAHRVYDGYHAYDEEADPFDQPYLVTPNGTNDNRSIAA